MVLPKQLCCEYIESHDGNFCFGFNPRPLDDDEIKNKEPWKTLNITEKERKIGHRTLCTRVYKSKFKNKSSKKKNGNSSAAETL